MKQFARLVKMYTALSNYTKAAYADYKLTGKPLQRALSSEFSQDSGSWEVEHEYMYGEELLVAPVLQVIYYLYVVYCYIIYITGIVLCICSIILYNIYIKGIVLCICSIILYNIYYRYCIMCM